LLGPAAAPEGDPIEAARAIGYVGAGTFEYLLDAEGNFFFMEMNTRLQVEHPVTEAITGLDLVELQLRIAAGEPLPMTQDDVTFTGHAIEVRLCAEDANAGFMPQSGTLALWKPAPFLRVDHALRSGSRVPPQYDSMIAKLIAHGTSREDARRKLLAGLEQTVAIGLRTNRDFLADCLSHPVFAAGAATTGFIGDHGDDLLGGDAGAQARAAMIAAAMLRAGPGIRLVHGFPTPMHLSRGETDYHPVLRVVDVQGPRVTLDLNGALQPAILLRDRDDVTIQIDGRCHDFRDLSFAPVVTAVAGGDGRLRATMNGTVMAVDVAVGDAVIAGQRLLVVEAMKMEHAHASPLSGTVTAVNVEKGMQVSARAVLIEIEGD